MKLAAERAGISIEDLAIRSGVPSSTLNQWLVRGKLPRGRDREIGQLAIELDVSPNWLRHGPDEPIPKISHEFFNIIQVSSDEAWHNGILRTTFDRFKDASDDNAFKYFDIEDKDSWDILTYLPSVIMRDGRFCVIRSRDFVKIWNVDKAQQQLQISLGLRDVEFLSSSESADLQRFLKVDLGSHDGEQWGVRSGNVYRALESFLDEPVTGGDDNFEELQQRPATFQFGTRSGAIFAEALKESSSNQLASDMLAELITKSHDLIERLKRTQAPQHVLDTVDRLIQELDNPLSAIRPGILLSRSRSIDAVIAAYDSEEGRSEMLLDAQVLIRDFADSLEDFKATFPTIAQIEANRLALSLTPASLEAALSAAEKVSQIAENSPVVEKSAVSALNLTAVDIDETRQIERHTSDERAVAKAIEARSRLVALRILDVRNFLAQSISAGQHELLQLSKDSALSARKGLVEGVGEAAKDIAKASIKGGFLLLVHSIFGPTAALAVLFGSFGQLERKAKALKEDSKEIS